MSRIDLLVWTNWASSAFINVEQSFSMYIPYAEITMSSVDDVGQLSAIKSTHWECTALYNGSPVKFAMFEPDARFVVAQIWFMSPAMSSVPRVDRAWDWDDDKTALMPASFCAASDVSIFIASSPSLAFSMAFTSSAVLGMTSMFKFLKSTN